MDQPPNPEAAREAITRVSPESWKLTLGTGLRTTQIDRVNAAEMPADYKAAIVATLNACTAEIVRLDVHCHVVKPAGKTRIILNLDLAEL